MVVNLVVRSTKNYVPLPSQQLLGSSPPDTNLMEFAPCDARMETGMLKSPAVGTGQGTGCVTTKRQVNSFLVPYSLQSYMACEDPKP